MRHNNHIIPAIGSEWLAPNCIYAGMVRGRNGEPDYCLLAGPECDGERMWYDAMAWVAALTVNVMTEFHLPTQAEQQILRATVPELFKPEVYWSCESHTTDDSIAGVQFFSDGAQCFDYKNSRARARAVLRLHFS
jgi:hypothetical protein